MKMRLCFLLALALSLGFAAAANADQFPSSTSFEKWVMGNDTYITTGVDEYGTTTGTSYWLYEGDEDGNSSKIIQEDMSLVPVSRPAGAANFDESSRTNVLQVATPHSAPLFRTIQASQNPVSLEDTSLFVDTLVQFSVTKSNDTVSVALDGSGNPKDKLMLYLQENLDGSTNLMIAASEIYDAGDGLESDYQFRTAQVVLSNSTLGEVSADTWYRLTISAKTATTTEDEEPARKTYVVFNVYIDGNKMAVAVGDLLDMCSGDTSDLPSLQGADSTSLAFVGFAGNGYVDDLVITTFDPFVSSVDFTLALGEATAVWYSINGGTPTYLNSGSANAQVQPGWSIVLSGLDYTAAEMADTPVLVGVDYADASGTNFTVTASSGSASITLTAKDAYATVDGQKYDSFASALAAADGKTVSLLRDISLDSVATIANGTSVALDLAGSNVTGSVANLFTVNGTFTILDSVAAAGGASTGLVSTTTAPVVNVSDGGSFAFQSGKIGTASAVAVASAGTATITGGDVLGTLSGSVTIPGTSTARFATDESAFCASGYETTLSGEWYVVTAIPSSGIDFTFVCGANVSAVYWTVSDGVTTTEYTEADTAHNVASTDTIAITKVSYADGYMPDGEYKRGWSGTGYTANQELTVQAAKIESGEDLPAGTTAEDIGITNSVFASYSTESSGLTNLMRWATSGSVTIAQINSMEFDANGNPETDLAEAYLLNCTEAGLDAAKADFKFTAYPATADQFSDKGYNGTVSIEGAASLDDPQWSTETAGPFNRATLKLD